MQLTYGLLQNINSLATFNKGLSGATVAYVMLSANETAQFNRWTYNNNYYIRWF